MNQALRFATYQAATAWMADNDQYGMVHNTLRGFIIVRFHEGQQYALTSPTEGVRLTEW